jgi:hypothetical protein
MAAVLLVQLGAGSLTGAARDEKKHEQVRQCLERVFGPIRKVET